jgi:hypothetical protein
MAQATLVPPPPTQVKRPVTTAPAAPALPPPAFRFQSLLLSEPHSLAKGRSATLGVSLVAHAVLIAAIVILPILYDDTLPAPGEAVRAFFVAPAAMAPPPPPTAASSPRGPRRSADPGGPATAGGAEVRRSHRDPGRDPA